MEPGTGREALDAQSLPAAAGGAGGGGGGRECRDYIAALFDLQKKHREERELNAKMEERKQVLESVQQQICELQKKVKEVGTLCSRFDMYLKDDDADRAAEKAERERRKGLEKEAELKRLKQEYSELMERKQEVQRQVERHMLYQDFMKRVVIMTKFEDLQLLSGHLESLLHFRDQLYQKEIGVQEQVDQHRKAMLTLEDKHHLLRLHMSNQLSQLQTELEKTRAEALTWEKKWNHIQETAAKKTLLLGQIKIGTLNLYEMTDDKEEGEEGVDMNDTEKQLDKIKIFIQDHDDIVKQHQAFLNRQNDGQKRKEQKRAKAKKRIAAHSKKEEKR